MHFEMSAETLRFFSKPTALRLSDCAKAITDALQKYGCVITVVDGKPQIVTTDTPMDDYQTLIQRG